MNRSKPDNTEYKKQQDAFKSQIDDIQSKLQAVRQKVSNASANGPAQERRKALFNDLNGLKSHQAGNKASRGKVIDRIRVLQESTQKKVKDLQASKSKIPFKTVDAIDDRIDSLDREIESGSLRLADEKRAVQEMSNLRRHRKLVEGFAQQQQAIDADKAQIDALRVHLDDPEHKALMEKSDEIKKGLDETRAEIDQAQASRQTLLDQRTKLQSDLDAVYAEKRQHNETHRETMDAYYQKVNDEKARRAQRAREEKEAEEAQRAKMQAEQMREDAKLPAFEAQIHDCQTLIDQFARIGGIQTSQPQSTEDNSKHTNGLGQHNIRQVENQIPGGTLLKKKNQDEDEAYFVGGGKSKKKGNKKSQANNSNGGTSEDKLNVPLATLTALMGLSIPPPKSHSEIQTTIDSLDIKKAWYQANQEKQTKENVDKAEKEIEKLFAKKKVDKHSGEQAEPKAADMSTTTNNLRVGLNKGYPTTQLPKRVKPSHRKGANSERGRLVKGVIREVAGFAPYEKRVMELLRNSKDKKARKLTKKRLGTLRRAKGKVEELSSVIQEARTKGTN